MYPFSEISQFEQESLDAHNHYRKLHATPPLAYNTNMRADCQAWAEVLAPRNEMEHSKTKNGENIWYKWSSGEMEFTGWCLATVEQSVDPESLHLHCTDQQPHDASDEALSPYTLCT